MAATWFLVVVVAGLSMFHANAAETDVAKREPRPVDSVDKRIILRMKRLPRRSPSADDLQNIIRQSPINIRSALKPVEYMPDAQNLDQHNIHQRSLEASEASKSAKNMVKTTPLKKAIGSVDSVDKRIILRMKRLHRRSLIADDRQNIIRQPRTHSRIALKPVEYMPDVQNLV